MKIYSCIVLLVFTLTQCTYTLEKYHDYKVQEILTISDRVGEVINREERDRYNLFPGIEDFQEARFFAQQHSVFVIEISTKQHKLAANYDNLLIVEMLTEYIHSTDSIQEKWKSLEEKWQIVDYDDLGLPITKDDVSRHRNRISTCISGGCAGSVVAGVIAIVVNGTLDKSGWRDLSTPLAGLTGCVVGFPVGMVAGYYYEDKYVFHRIKQARKLHIVKITD